MACAPSEDSDQPGHPPSLIRVFAVRMKKAWVLPPERTAKTVIRLGGCPGWSKSSVGAQSFLLVLSRGGSYIVRILDDPTAVLLLICPGVVKWIVFFFYFYLHNVFCSAVVVCMFQLRKFLHFPYNIPVVCLMWLTKSILSFLTNVSFNILPFLKVVALLHLKYFVSETIDF